MKNLVGIVLVLISTCNLAYAEVKTIRIDAEIFQSEINHPEFSLGEKVTIDYLLDFSTATPKYVFDEAIKGISFNGQQSVQFPLASGHSFLTNGDIVSSPGIISLNSSTAGRLDGITSIRWDYATNSPDTFSSVDHVVNKLSTYDYSKPSFQNTIQFSNGFSLVSARVTSFAFVAPIITPPVVNSPVPEPETYSMLVLGLAVMGFNARRRKYNN